MIVFFHDIASGCSWGLSIIGLTVVSARCWCR